MKKNKNKYKNKNRYLKYLKVIFSFDKRLILISVYEILINIIYYLIPMGIVAYICNIYQKNPTSGFKEAFIMCAVYATINLVLGAINIFLFQYFYDKIMLQIQKKLILSLYKKIEEIDYDTYQSNEFLDMYQKQIDDGVQNIYNAFWNGVSFIAPLMSLFSIAGILSLINPLIILYAIIISVIYYLISIVYTKISHILSEKNTQLVRERGYIKRLFYLKDSSIDIKTSKISALFLEKNNQIGDKVLKNVDKYGLRTSLISFFNEFLLRTVYVLSLILISYKTIKLDNILIIATLITASQSFIQIISQIGSAFAGIKYYDVFSDDYFRIIDKTSTKEISGEKSPLPALQTISFRDVSFTYDGANKPSLNKVNLDINKNEKIAIVGENGAGKTTLIKLLLRLYDPTQGDIFYNDLNYLDINPYNLQSNFVCVFQNYQIFACSVAENILMRKVASESDEQIVKDALQKVGLLDKIMSFEKNIHTMVTKEFDKDGIELSGGERQRLVIARVFASSKKIIILDEPNSAIDAISEKEIFENIFEFSVDKTLIFISHRFSTTIKADKIYLFENGEITESGTHLELMKKKKKYYEMFMIQAKEYQLGVNAK